MSRRRPFNSKHCLPEWVGTSRHHKSKIRSNHPAVGEVTQRNPCSRNKTDKHLLAFLHARDENNAGMSGSSIFPSALFSIELQNGQGKRGKKADRPHRTGKPDKPPIPLVRAFAGGRQIWIGGACPTRTIDRPSRERDEPSGSGEHPAFVQAQGHEPGSR